MVLLHRLPRSDTITVKDAYSIPVVNELLDELFGAHFFTELDFHFGYH